MRSKTIQSASTLNKNEILNWINQTLNSNQTKIQSLGNGIVYCLLMNHYYPNSIPKHKIITVPRNNMDNKANLKRVQQALFLHNIKSISFDIFRVSEMSYLDNWQLICKFQRHFDELSKNQGRENQKTKLFHQSTHQNNLNHPNGAYSISNQIRFASLSVQNQTNSQSLNQNVLTYREQNNLYLPKEISRTPDFGTGLLTPMKGMKIFDQNTKLRCEALRLMQEIKSVVKSETESDRIKVKNLKKMLGLIEEESQEQELQLKQLFSDCKQKQQIITID